MPKLSIVQAAALAARWGCTSRTIYSWKSRGLDLENPLEIADAIACTKNPSLGQLQAALSEVIKHHESTLESIIP